MQSIIKHIDHIGSSISKISGSVVIIELKMRLLAESNKAFKDEVYRQIKGSKTAKNKNRNEFWNCDLDVLCKSVIAVFDDKLGLEDKSVIVFFNKPRNKMLHGDLVGLMITFGLTAEGQEIYSSGRRNILESANIKQAIASFERNEGVKRLQNVCSKMDSIVDKLLNCS